MSIVYLVALAAFCVVLLAVMIEAVVTVSRKPAWHDGLHALEQDLLRVDTADRSSQQLPTFSPARRQPEAVPAMATSAVKTAEVAKVAKVAKVEEAV